MSKVDLSLKARQERKSKLKNEQSKQRPLVLSIKDIAHLTHQVGGIKIGNQPVANDTTALNKEALKLASKEKVNRWKSTVKNTRKQKLEEREERLKQEEEERVKIDQAFEQETRERRQQAIDRAKKMVFYEQDKVKKIHSHVLLDLVLQERDQQILFKEQKKKIYTQFDNLWQKEFEQQLEKREEEQLNRLKVSHEGQISTAKEQHEQHEQKIAQKKKEIQLRNEEGKAIIKNDEKYLQEQEEKSKTIRMQQLAFKQDLEEMKEMKKKIKEQMNQYEQMKKAEIELYREETEGRENLRKEAEEKILRERIGNQQYEYLEKERNKKNDWVEMRMNEKQLEEKSKEEERQRMKEQTQQEMIQFFDQVKQEKLLKEKEKKEFNQWAQLENERIRLEIEKEFQNNRMRILEKGKRDHDFYTQQIKEKKEKKEKEKQERLQAKVNLKDNLAAEKKELAEYIQSLLQEPWMKNNPRKGNVYEYLKSAYRGLNENLNDFVES